MEGVQLRLWHLTIPRTVTGRRLRFRLGASVSVTSGASFGLFKGEATWDDLCQGTTGVRGLLALVITQLEQNDTGQHVFVQGAVSYVSSAESWISLTFG